VGIPFPEEQLDHRNAGYRFLEKGIDGREVGTHLPEGIPAQAPKPGGHEEHDREGEAEQQGQAPVHP